MATCGPQDGRGHLGRALAIAEALAALDVRAELELVRGALGPVEAERAGASGLAMADEDGPAADAVVVLDVPDLAAEAGRFDARRLVVFDDRDALDGPAAIAIQPSQPAWHGRGPAAAVLAGYRYAPIASAYRRLRPSATPGPDVVGRSGSTAGPLRPARVLVCFGGSDPANVSGRLAGKLADGDGWAAELVLGAGAAADTGGWHVPVVRDPADLPDRVAAADMALIGAGTMKFEVACLGVPALLLAVADDQLAVGPPFAATGAARYLGDGRTIAPAAVRAAIDALVADAPGRITMARAARQVVDGDGSRRIAEAIAALAAAPH